MLHEEASAFIEIDKDISNPKHFSTPQSLDAIEEHYFHSVKKMGAIQAKRLKYSR